MSTILSAAEIEARAKRKESNSEAYLDLETPVRELAYMAAIVEDLAWRLLHDQSNIKVDGDDVVITLTEFERERFIYAIEKVGDQARAIDKKYLAQ